MLKNGATVAMEYREFERDGKKYAMGFVRDPSRIWIGIRSESKK